MPKALHAVGKKRVVPPRTEHAPVVPVKSESLCTPAANRADPSPEPVEPMCPSLDMPKEEGSSVSQKDDDAGEASIVPISDELQEPQTDVPREGAQSHSVEEQEADVAKTSPEVESAPSEPSSIDTTALPGEEPQPAEEVPKEGGGGVASPNVEAAPICMDAPPVETSQATEGDVPKEGSPSPKVAAVSSEASVAAPISDDVPAEEQPGDVEVGGRATVDGAPQASVVLPCEDVVEEATAGDAGKPASAPKVQCAPPPSEPSSIAPLSCGQGVREVAVQTSQPPDTTASQFETLRADQRATLRIVTNIEAAMKRLVAANGAKRPPQKQAEKAKKQDEVETVEKKFPVQKSKPKAKKVSEKAPKAVDTKLKLKLAEKVNEKKKEKKEDKKEKDEKDTQTTPEAFIRTHARVEIRDVKNLGALKFDVNKKVVQADDQVFCVNCEGVTPSDPVFCVVSWQQEWAEVLQWGTRTGGCFRNSSGALTIVAARAVLTEVLLRHICALSHTRYGEARLAAYMSPTTSWLLPAVSLVMENTFSARVAKLGLLYESYRAGLSLHVWCPALAAVQRAAQPALQMHPTLNIVAFETLDAAGRRELEETFGPVPPKDTYLCARIEGHAVGFIAGTPRDATTWQVSQLCVIQPEHSHSHIEPALCAATLVTTGTTTLVHLGGQLWEGWTPPHADTVPTGASTFSMTPLDAPEDPGLPPTGRRAAKRKSESTGLKPKQQRRENLGTRLTRTQLRGGGTARASQQRTEEYCAEQMCIVPEGLPCVEPAPPASPEVSEEETMFTTWAAALPVPEYAESVVCLQHLGIALLMHTFKEDSAENVLAETSKQHILNCEHAPFVTALEVVSTAAATASLAKALDAFAAQNTPQNDCYFALATELDAIFSTTEQFEARESVWTLIAALPTG